MLVKQLNPLDYYNKLGAVFLTGGASRYFESKFFHQLHLNFLDFQKPVPLILKEVVYFLMEMTNLQFRFKINAKYPVPLLPWTSQPQ
jgi:hypothetical protein